MIKFNEEEKIKNKKILNDYADMTNYLLRHYTVIFTRNMITKQIEHKAAFFTENLDMHNYINDETVRFQKYKIDYVIYVDGKIW